MIKANHLQVELTNYCNLACVECPHRMMERPLQHMEYDVFSKVIELIKSHNFHTIILHKDGEPLMHPKFIEYFELIAYHTKAKLDLYTNAYLLRKDMFKRMCEAISPNKNKLWVLVTFHMHKYDGSRYEYEKAEKNVMDCLEFRWPNVQFVLASHKTDFTSEDEMKKWYVRWQNVATEYDNIENVHANTHISPWGGRIEQKEGMVHYYTCPYGDSAHFFIGSTGNIIPCCIDLDEEIVFGNILTDDLKEVENKRQLFYKTIMQDNVEFELCRKCLT